MGLDFVLIDADHSSAGVQRDINNVLRYRPTRPLYIVMHDSFNPGAADVIMGENESLTYQTALRHSVYRFQKWWNPFFSVPEAIYWARRKAVGILRTHSPQLYDTLKPRRRRFT